MKILLTGGSGFVGRNVLAYYENNDEVVIDAPTSKELNCIDEEAVKNWLLRGQYDVVLNFAGYSSVGSKMQKDDSKIFEYNMKMFMNFAKYSHLYKKMFWTGSGAEFGRGNNLSMVKESEIDQFLIPTDQYGLEKYCIGRYIEQSDNIYNLRLFGIFGPHEYLEKRFISNMIVDAIMKKDYIIKQNCRFDYLWIGDFVCILDQFIKLGKPKYHTYNLVSGNPIELYEIAKLVRKITKWDARILVENESMGNDYSADNTRLMEELPEFSFTKIEDSISDYYGWILKSDLLKG